MKNLIYICLLLIIPFSANAANNETSLAQQLTLLDDYGHRNDNSIIVNRFRYLLDSLSNSFNEDKQDIAEITFICKKMLADRGVDESLLNIMEGFNSIFEKKTGYTRYKEYVAAYIQSRAKGATHEATIKGLNDIVKSVR